MRTRLNAKVAKFLVVLGVVALVLTSCSNDQPAERLAAQSVQLNTGAMRSVWVKKTHLLPPAAPKVHVLQNQEVLWNVAEVELGDPNLWPRLFDANPDIVDPNVVADGQAIRIPGPAEQLESRPLPEPPPPVVHHARSSKQASTDSGSEPEVRHSNSAASSGGESGGASWYYYQPGGCAHKSLPMGTTVTVTNTENGRRTTCVVDDRGPFIGGRVIDLDQTVFSQIADPGEGVVPVQISS